MSRTHALVSWLLRAAILLYLFCQMLVCFFFMLVYSVITFWDMQGSNPLPDPAWKTATLFGVVAFSSAVLFQGLVSRLFWGKYHPLYLVAAIAMVVVCINPIILIHEVGNTSLASHLGYGFPLIVNATILSITFSKTISRFLFPNKCNQFQFFPPSRSPLSDTQNGEADPDSSPRKPTLFPLLIRSAILLFLFCQMFYSLYSAYVFIRVIAQLMQTPGPLFLPPWMTAATYVVTGVSSLFLLAGLVRRSVWGKHRSLYLCFALAILFMHFNPVTFLYAAFEAPLSYRLVYGASLLVNAFILVVLLSKRLFAYIFHPGPLNRRLTCSPKT